ncbi:MAG TPA: TolC family protein, partial [Bacteroidales bacterium]|nr:TolC family protein [Bacteroidales bacterium]
MSKLSEVILVVFISAVMVPAARPQASVDDSVKSFSLSQAVDYALQYNTSVQNAGLDIISARKKVWETTAIGLPQVNGALNYQHLPGPLPVVDFGSSQAPLYNYIFESLRELGYPPPDTLTNSMGGGPITLGVKNSTTYSVTVSQMVFSGEYIVGLQASKVFLELSKNAKEKTEQDTRENVTNSYYTILVLEKNLEILDSSVVNLEKTLRETKAMVDQGFLEETDYEQLKVTKNTVDNSMRAIERQKELALMLFKIQLGLKVDDSVNLTQGLNAFVPDSENVSVLTQPFNVGENISYKMADTQVKIDALNVKREKSAYLPSVSAFYQYQDKTNKATFDFTFNNIIGVNASIPIFSSFQRHAKVQQAELALE